MNEKIRKLLDACPSYMVAQFDEDVVQGRSIIVDEEDGTINPVFAKDEITGTYAECVRIWLV